MALSNPKNKNPIVALTERYFCMVFQKYGIPFPVDASWQEMDTVPSLGGNELILQEVPNMLFEIADLFEKARVEELVKGCAKLLLNSGNLHRQFTKITSELFDKGITWGRIVTFFSFAVTFAIYLCTNEMSHLAARICPWAAQYVQNRIQPWIDDNGGWVSNGCIS